MKEVKIITHNGSFHPDEVFAIATLLSVFEHRRVTPKVTRTRDTTIIKKGDIVVDVGGEYDPEHLRFDHHQEGGAGERSNTIPYASFGLVWKHYGELVCGSKDVAARIDKKLVQSIDAIDNGLEISKFLYKDVYPYSIFDIVSAFAPSWNEPKSHVNKAFLEAVSLARKILEREIKKSKDKIQGEHFVEEQYRRAEDKRLIVLDRDYSWGEVLALHPEPLFVVEPVEQNNTWRVKAVRDDRYSFKNRKNFPKSWAGKREAALVKVSGVPDALFCHNKLFIAVAQSKEGAIMLAKKAIEH